MKQPLWVLMQWTAQGPSVSRPMTRAKAYEALTLVAETMRPEDSAEIVTVERYKRDHAPQLQAA